MRQPTICFFLLTFSFIPFALGQESQTYSKELSALLAANAANDRLQSPDAKPWRMIAEYQLYDSFGKPVASGSYEYDWVAPGKSRTLWSRGNTTASLWSLPGSPDAVTGKIEQLSAFERDIRDLAFGLLPSRLVLAQYDLSLQTIPFGQAKLRCILLNPKKNLPAQTPAAFSGYCFDLDKPQLRLMTHQTNGLTLVVMDNPALFRDISIPRHVIAARDGHTIFKLDITELKDSQDSPSEFTPPASALPLHLQYSSTKIINMLETAPKFTYPQKVKELNLSGHVMLQAHVGKDGHVHSLQIDSGMQVLREAASDNVKQLIFHPYFLEGQPVDFDVSFDVNFTSDYHMIVIESPSELHEQCPHFIGGVISGNPLCAATSTEEVPEVF
jgi:hypothetical protein